MAIVSRAMCAHAQHEHAPTMALLTMALLTMALLTMALLTMAPLTMALLPMAHMSSTSTPPPTGTPQEKRTAPQGSSSAAAALSACSASMAPLGTCGNRRVLLRLQACLTAVAGMLDYSCRPIGGAARTCTVARVGCPGRLSSSVARVGRAALAHRRVAAFSMAHASSVHVASAASEMRIATGTCLGSGLGSGSGSGLRLGFGLGSGSGSG